MNLFKASKRFCISLILIFLIGAMPFSTALEGYIEEINPDTHGGNTGGNADANQNHETSGNVCNAEQLKKFDLNSNNALDASDVLIMERIFKRVDPSSAIASLDSKELRFQIIILNAAVLTLIMTRMLILMI